MEKRKKLLALLLAMIMLFAALPAAALAAELAGDEESDSSAEDTDILEEDGFVEGGDVEIPETPSQSDAEVKDEEKPANFVEGGGLDTPEKGEEAPAEPVKVPAKAVAASGNCGDDLTWAFDAENGTLTISGTGEMWDYTYGTTLPWADYRSDIRTVAIKSGVTSIGACAFNYCTSLTSITIPDSVTSIGHDAFCGCKSLTSITIPSSVTYIGNFAFGYADDMDLEKVGGFTISGYTGTAAETYANENDISFIALDEPDDPAPVATSGKCGDDLTWEFDEATGTLTISGTGEMWSFDGTPWMDFTDLIKSVVIEKGATSIGARTFCYCSDLISVTIPDSVTWIGFEAFLECTSLQRVVFPDSVTEIGHGAFENCSNLNDIIISNGITDVAKSTFSGTPWMESQGEFVIVNGILVAYQGTDSIVTIPDSVTEIGSEAFYGHSNVTKVTIPNSVTSIGSHAFCRCDSLTDIAIPSCVTQIGVWAFSGTPWLEAQGNFVIVNDILIRYQGKDGSVTVPDNVIKINDMAFWGNSELQNVTIPNHVTSIGESAFALYAWSTGDAGGYGYTDGFTIYGYPGTAAEKYATENELTFIALSEDFEVICPDRVLSGQSDDPVPSIDPIESVLPDNQTAPITPDKPAGSDASDPPASEGQNEESGKNQRKKKNTPAASKGVVVAETTEEPVVTNTLDEQNAAELPDVPIEPEVPDVPAATEPTELIEQVEPVQEKTDEEGTHSEETDTGNTKKWIPVVAVSGGAAAAAMTAGAVHIRRKKRV